MKTKENTQSRERRRLKELYSFHILDTLPEQEYDDLTKIAAQICGTKISLVSLIDKDRQWFKSTYGTDASETPRSQAFCSDVIKTTNEVLIIPDATKDERFKDNPLVTGDPKIVFYAGVPITTSLGCPLGTICVIDDEPKQLSEEQLSALKGLGRQVERLLELRKKKLELENSLKEQKVLQLKYMAAHVNPNNIFSSMSAFQSLFLDKSVEKALNFTSLLANYMRRKYEQSTMLLIPLKEELKNAEMFVSFERERTKKDFEFHIYNAVNEKEILVPPMILQPIISNAIVHGFATMKTGGQILIGIKETETGIVISVTDNGRGFKRAIDTSKTRSPKQSTELTKLYKRLELYSDLDKSVYNLKIEDIGSPDDSLGTTAIFTLPLKKQ